MSLCQWPTEETTTTATEADDMTNTKGLGTEKGNDDDEDDDDDDKGGGTLLEVATEEVHRKQGAETRCLVMT